MTATLPLQVELDHARIELGELIAQHAQGRDLTELVRFENNPLAFITDELHGSPWSAQRRVAELVRDRPLVAVATANACGKGWLAARLALWWVYCRRGLVLVTSAVERQITEAFMGEVARAWRDTALPGDLGQHGLKVPGLDAGILAFTSTAASRMTGHHAGHVFAIIDEAQGCSEFSWEGLLSCATGDEDRLLVLGNPLHPTGPFARCFDPASAWATVRVSALEHPNLTLAEPRISGGPSALGIERMAQQWGRESPTFGARALGVFPVDASDALGRFSWIERAQTRWRAAPPFDSQRPTVIGLDIARLGGDSCALAVRQANVLYEIVAWRGTDLVETLARVRHELGRLGLARQIDPRTRIVRERRGPEPTIVIDEVGIGAGVFDTLRHLGGRVIGWNAGRKPSLGGEGKFLNLRAESAWRVRRLLEQDMIALPPDVRLSDELCATRYRTEPTSGKLALVSKDETRQALGRSPDSFDATVMAFGLELASPCTTGTISGISF